MKTAALLLLTLCACAGTPSPIRTANTMDVGRKVLAAVASLSSDSSVLNHAAQADADLGALSRALDLGADVSSLAPCAADSLKLIESDGIRPELRAGLHDVELLLRAYGGACVP